MSRSPSIERDRLDAARHQQGWLFALVTVPYLVAYLVLVLGLTGSPNMSNGVFIVVFAVLLVSTLVGRGLRTSESAVATRIAVAVGSALVGLVVAFLVNAGIG